MIMYLDKRTLSIKVIQWFITYTNYTHAEAFIYPDRIYETGYIACKIWLDLAESWVLIKFKLTFDEKNS